MDQSQLKWVADFIWNIADDRLRDVYVRGKYRDVILPFTVLRRLDAVLEATKDAVLERKKFLDTHKVAEQDGALRMAAGQAFYNVSEFTLAKLKASAAGQRLRDDFIAYLADHVEAFIATLKRPEPAIARVGARAAHQQREPLAAAPLGGGEVGGVEFGLAHQRRGHRLHGRFEQVEQMFLQASVDVARGHVVNDGVLESVTHGQCSVVGTDVMNALFGLKAKRIRDGTIRCCEVVKR